MDKDAKELPTPSRRSRSPSLDLTGLQGLAPCPASKEKRWRSAKKSAARSSRWRTPRRSPRPWKWSPRPRCARRRTACARRVRTRQDPQHHGHLSRANPEYKHPFMVGGDAKAVGFIVSDRQGPVRRPEHQHAARRHGQDEGSAGGRQQSRRWPSATRAWLPEPHRRHRGGARDPAGRRAAARQADRPGQGACWTPTSKASSTPSTCATRSSSTR
jgi:hypothetical protein